MNCKGKIAPFEYGNMLIFELYALSCMLCASYEIQKKKSAYTKHDPSIV